MSKPKSEVEDKTYFRDIHFLYEIIEKLKGVDEIKLFLKDLLTRTELRMFKRRWHIACLLDQGFDIRAASRESQTSTTTVNRIKNILENGYGGLRIALERTRHLREPKKKRYGTTRSQQIRRLMYGKEIDLA